MASGAWHLTQFLVHPIAATLCLLRAVAREDERIPWLLFGFGILSYGAANEVSWALEAGGGVVPYPSFADALWLTFYASALVA